MTKFSKRISSTLLILVATLVALGSAPCHMPPETPVAVEEAPCLRARLIASSTSEPSLASGIFQLLTCDGAPVAGFNPENFQVSERGVTGLESSNAVCRRASDFRLEVVLLIDLSRSMWGQETIDAEGRTALDHLKLSIREMADALLDGSERVALNLWAFDGSEEIKPVFVNVTNPEQIDYHLRDLTCPSMYCSDESTNLYGAIINGAVLARAESRAARSSYQHSEVALVIFSDGADQAMRHTAREARTAVDTIESEGVRVFTIGLGTEVNRGVLNSFGRSGSFHVSAVDRLSSLFNRLGRNLSAWSNSYYEVRYCSPRRAGAHVLTVNASGDYTYYDNASHLLTIPYEAEGFSGGCLPDMEPPAEAPATRGSSIIIEIPGYPQPQ